jgi:hypothetical protein
MNRIRPYLLIALVFLLTAALLRFWITPFTERLSADYTSVTHLTVQDRFRDSPSGDWQTTILTNRRADQTINSLGQVSIIQGNLFVSSDSGSVIFESTGLYGVDRRTLSNVSGYGDTERSGQYLFPPHLTSTTYEYWDPMFIGPRTAVYNHTETLDGLLVYVYNFNGNGMDETVGYSTLPGVPELYRALTDGQGALWIEPTSGIVVDYQEQGLSYFVDQVTGERLEDFHTWSGRYTPDTLAAQLKLARSTRLRTLALEIGLPGGLVLFGLLWLVVGFTRPKK